VKACAFDGIQDKLPLKPIKAQAFFHDFTFTPAMSLHVTCATENEIDNLYAALSQGGQVFMPLDTYPFSKKYAWLNDQFGVSWQLMLADA